MYAAIDVLHGMIDNLVRVVGCESFVGQQSIGIECRASLYVLANLRLQFMSLAVWYDCGPNLSAPLKDSHDGGFVFGASASDSALALTQMHIAGFAADERFINFDLSTHHRRVSIRRSHPE